MRGMGLQITAPIEALEVGPTLDLQPAFRKLADANPGVRELFFKLSFLHLQPLNGPRSRLSAWLTGTLLGKE